jgi:DNA-binding NarL/FixJ family response regulator
MMRHYGPHKKLTEDDDYVADLSPRQLMIMAYDLTHREWQVLVLMTQGFATKQIARHLGNVSYRTIEIHRARVIEKLGARNTVHAAVLAIQKGLISLDEAASPDAAIPQEEHPCPGQQTGAARGWERVRLS